MSFSYSARLQTPKLLIMCRQICVDKCRQVLSNKNVQRKFQERVRLTVYLEKSERTSLAVLAGGAGRLSEWSRERLVEQLADNTDLPQSGDLPVARRRTVPGSNPGRVGGAREPDFGKSAAGAPVSSQKCEHHKQRGELCYKCDAKFGLPKIGG